MKEYVAAFIFDLSGNRVILIRKNKPAWQAGLLNAVGGSIEENETPLEAIIREVKEEIDLSISVFKNYASLSDNKTFKVYWFYTFTNKIGLFKNNTSEIAEIFHVKNIPSDTIPNVPYLMHMALNFEKDNCDFLEIKEVYNV